MTVTAESKKCGYRWSRWLSGRCLMIGKVFTLFLRIDISQISQFAPTALLCLIVFCQDYWPVLVRCALFVVSSILKHCTNSRLLSAWIKPWHRWTKKVIISSLHSQIRSIFSSFLSLPFFHHISYNRPLSPRSSSLVSLSHRFNFSGPQIAQTVIVLCWHVYQFSYRRAPVNSSRLFTIPLRFLLSFRSCIQGPKLISWSTGSVRFQPLSSPSQGTLRKCCGFN